MNIPVLLAAALLLVPTHDAHSGDSASWHCVAEDDARLLRQRVADQMQPRVVFQDEAVDRGVVARMAVHQATALSVAVIRNGKLDWSSAWGLLERDGATADCSTLFQGGSLAKPTTLIAALRMKQAGVIPLDADVETLLRSYHLPKGWQSPENPVTLRNLLRHTAGITPGGYAGYAPGAALPTTTQILLGQPPANSRAIEVVARPGEHLSYSGGGYTLIEAALQDRLQQPFDQLMQKWLLAPLGMQQTSFRQPIPETDRGHAAKGHLADGSPVPGGWNNHPERAAAGLWTTPSDMAILLIEVYQASRGMSATLGQGLVEELLQDPVEGHAYGFRRIGDGDDVFLTHYGGTVGYRAGMTINLRTGNGAVYLANSDAGSELGAELLNAVSEVYDWTEFKTTSVKRSPKPRPVLESLVGLYDFPESPTVRVVLEGESLTLVFPNKDRYALTPIEGADLAFIHPATGVRVAFEPGSDHMTLHLYGEEGRRRQ